eukprot:5233125-Prymnesium_polylepis.1
MDKVRELAPAPPSFPSFAHCTIESVMATSVSSARFLSATSCSVVSVSAWCVTVSRERPSHMLATMFFASRSQS